jgi:hypothetical protein
MLQWTLAKDIKTFSTQLAHWSLSEVAICNNAAVINVSGFRKLDWPEFSNHLIIKISSNKPLDFCSKDADITNCTKFEEDKFITYTLSVCAKDIKADIIKIEWSPNRI